MMDDERVAGVEASPGYHQQKLVPTIIFCTSEDEHFPVTELTRLVPSSRGWQSEKQCSFPQQIGIRFDGEVFLDQLQILVHESKIPSQVEVFVSEPPPQRDDEISQRVFPPYEACAFQRLGYLSFKNNRDGRYKSGELRAAIVQQKVLYVKLLVWECHSHALNFYNQVSICSITCTGRVERSYIPSAMFPHQRAANGGVLLTDKGKPTHLVFQASLDAAGMHYKLT